MELKERIEVGSNSLGYQFAVGSIPDEDGGVRWLGFADSTEGAFIFTQICDGYMTGIKDKEQAIRMTGAIAQSAENGYGGVEHWFVDEHLRGKPEDFTCRTCREIHTGECSSTFDYEEDDDE